MTSLEHTDRVHKCITKIRADMKKHNFIGVERDIQVKQKNITIGYWARKYKLNVANIKTIYNGSPKK